MEVNIVGAKTNVCSEYRDLFVESNTETRAYVTDVTSRVSFAATSTKTDSLHPFESNNFNVRCNNKRKWLSCTP